VTNPADLQTAFFEDQRDPVQMPFVVNDSVAVITGSNAGSTGAVVAVTQIESALTFTVELSSGKDISLPANAIRLLQGYS
jgi:hypothetical protein